MTTSTYSERPYLRRWTPNTYRRVIRWQRSWITWMRRYDNHTLPQMPGGTC